MPSDVVPDATPREVTPVVGKGALGAWRALKRHSPEVGVNPHKTDIATIECNADSNLTVIIDPFGQHTRHIGSTLIKYEVSRSVHDGFDGYGNVIASHILGMNELGQVTVVRVDTEIPFTLRIGIYLVDHTGVITFRDSSGVLAKKDFDQDAQGNPTQVVLDPGGIHAVTTLGYDDLGNRISVTNADGPTTNTA